MEKISTISRIDTKHEYDGEIFRRESKCSNPYSLFAVDVNTKDQGFVLEVNVQYEFLQCESVTFGEAILSLARRNTTTFTASQSSSKSK